MRPTLSSALLALAAMALLAPTAARAQERERSAADWLDDCRRGNGWGNDDDRACDVREVTLPSLNGTLRVDGGPNGGVSLIGWDRKEVKIVARISANSRTDGEAAQMLKEIRVLTEVLAPLLLTLPPNLRGGCHMPRSGPRTVRKYSDEFKLTAVRMSQQPGIQVKTVAAALEIHPFMLSKW